MKNSFIERSMLPQRVADFVRRELLAGMRPGDKLMPETMLAKRFGVSRGTVREAIATFVHEGLIERRAGGGTVMVTQPERHPRVGLWFLLEPTASYALHVLNDLLLNLEEQGLAVKTYMATGLPIRSASNPAHLDLMNDLRQHRLHAVGIVNGLMHAETLARIRTARVPMVGCPSDMSLDENDHLAAQVVSPSSVLVREGTRHLLAQGCRRIAWLAWSRSSWTPRLIEVFRQTLAEGDAVFRKEWLRMNEDPRMPGAGYEEFRDVWRAAREKPDGLLVSDDMLLPDVALALRELGIRVPEQLRVAAHANKGMVTCPAFPAARLEMDPREHARVMSGYLAKAARGEPIEPRRTVLTLQLLLPQTVETRGHFVESAAVG